MRIIRWAALGTGWRQQQQQQADKIDIKRCEPRQPIEASQARAPGGS